MVFAMFAKTSFTLESCIKESERLGSYANQLARENNHVKAIELYSKAIELNANDHRFYLNKALCLQGLGFLDEALLDIEQAIQLIPDSAKPYLRKAEVFRLMKKYKDAEMLLNTILVSKLDVDVSTVCRELLNVRVSALAAYGFDNESVVDAAQKCQSISDAVEYIINKKMQSVKVRHVPKSYADVAKSAEKCLTKAEIKPSSPTVVAIPQSPKQLNGCLTPPSSSDSGNICTNLMGYKGLWVGNVSKSCKHEMLLALFQKYGDANIHQLKRAPCVFVKYNNVVSPTRAIQDLRGKLMEDICEDPKKPLSLHFDCNQEQLRDKFPKDRKPKNYPNGECYFWRTVGCPLDTKCPKRHVPINEKIDFQMWMLDDKSHKYPTTF